MSGQSAIDVPMTPDSFLLLHESISAHQTPSLHSTMPPRSATSMSKMKHLSTKEVVHWSLESVYTSKMDAPKGETTPESRRHLIY